MIAGVRVDASHFLAFSDLTCHLEDTVWCFLVAPYCLIVRRPNLEVATKRLLHQQVKIGGNFSAMFPHGSASLQLFLAVQIFLRFLGIICHDRAVLSEGHKNYFKCLQLLQVTPMCVMNSQPTFLFLTCLNLMNYGHVIKSI